MKSTKLIIPLLLILLGFISCKPKYSQNPLDYSKSLFKVSGAMNLQYSKLNGMDQLQYKVLANYPASVVISEIDSKLKKSGWAFFYKKIL